MNSLWKDTPREQAVQRDPFVEYRTFSIIIFAYLPVCVAVLRSCLLFGRYEHAQVATTGKESIHRPI
ncbi:hypothetical protein DTO212C5_3120 [Paecilomyces variotii]|nr:hypothetical protein DTO212C5_3120 [Paecilomyces variotii]